MKKTLQECKEIAAKNAGYPNWENVIENFFGTEDLGDLANKMYYEQDQCDCYYVRISDKYIECNICGIVRKILN